MRKRIYCAAALLGGASLASAQGFGGSTATGQPVSGYYGNQGYNVTQVGYSPEYAAYVQQAQAQAAMAGYGGAGFPGASAGYVQQAQASYPQAGYGYPSYGYGYGYQSPASVMGAAASGVPVLPEGEGVEGGAEVLPKAKYKWWIGADYLATFVQRQAVNVPLVTISTDTGAGAGAIGAPGTSTTFGDSINSNKMDGVRVDAGLFLDDARHYSLEFQGDFYAQGSELFSKFSDGNGNPTIGRPIFNVVTNLPAAVTDSQAGLFSGGINIDSKLNLFSTEVNVGYHCCGEGWTGAYLIGARYMRLSETLTLTDNLVEVGGGNLSFGGAANVLAAGELISDFDRFRTTNDFYGGQVGGRISWDGSWYYVTANGKVAVGVVEQEVDIQGATTLTRLDGTTSTLQGGVLALPSNIGTRRRTVFAYSPEAGLNLGLRLTQHLAVQAGYSFTYWSNVVRPGRQIDPNVNPSQIPTSVLFGTATGAPAAPGFQFQNEDLFVHTLSLGLNLRY